jgi:chromosome segregation ATPase
MTTLAFQTPPRILIPKLLRSRDAWEIKATQRKSERKALQIRVRDLAASRARHRSRADELQLQLDELQLQLDHTRQQRDQLQARLDAAPKK